MIRRIPLLVLVVVGALCATPAAAHEGPGRIELLASEPTGAGARTYRLRVVFVADGHAAPEATVTAVVVGQPGAVPVSFIPAGEEGVYEGTVRFPGPGEWTVRLTSLRPIASVERPETIASRLEATSTTAASPPGTREAVPAAAARDDGSGGKSTPTIVGVAIVLAAGAGVGVVVARRRRRSTSA